MAGIRFQSVFARLCLLIALIGGASRIAVQLPTQRPGRPPTPTRLPKISSRVIVISLSGFGADLANSEDARLRIPTIRRMRREGAHAIGLESVFPSQTGPAIASFLTGKLPADHGVGADLEFDEATGLPVGRASAAAGRIKGDPLWDYVAREGMTTAAVSFPLTEGAPIQFNLPDADAPSTPSTLKQEALSWAEPKTASALPPTLLPTPLKDRALAALLLKDAATVDAARYLLEKRAPHLLLLHLRSFASAQERFGLQSAESLSVLEQLDRMIDQLIESSRRTGLHNESTFLLFSEAGAARVDREFRPNVALAKKGWFKTGASWEAAVQSFGGSAAVYVRDASNQKLLREVEGLFLKMHEEPDSPIWRIFSRREASKLGADPRPAFYLDAAPGVVISGETGGSTIGKPTIRAASGYSPARAETRATLLLFGRGVRPGAKIEYARLLDLAPTIARMLGIEMKAARGRVLTEALAP
ncbi:MAG: alkaline phosphatase family protein [Blastocatellia bacterium]|nr:alkaline phosphatase family protein [Blastocatellia bacterium]